MLLPFLLAGAAASQPVPQIAFFDRMVAQESVLKLGDVADLKVLPVSLRDLAAALPLVTRSAKPIDRIDHAWLASRARSLMPALSPWFQGPFDGQTIFEPKGGAVSPIADCSPSDDGVTKGDTVTVRILSGPFQIERQTIAMQAAKSGDRLFVRTADGSALAALCAGDQ